MTHDPLLAALIEKLPVFDNSWPDPLKHAWWDCVDVLLKAILEFKRAEQRARHMREDPALTAEYGPAIAATPTLRCEDAGS